MQAKINVITVSSEIADYMLKDKFKDVPESEIFQGENYTPEYQEIFNTYYDDVFSIITNLSLDLED